jgi:hypothetical protein
VSLEGLDACAAEALGRSRIDFQHGDGGAVALFVSGQV